MKRILVIFCIVLLVLQILYACTGKVGVIGSGCPVIPTFTEGDMMAAVTPEPVPKAYESEPALMDAEDTWIDGIYQEYCKEIGGRYNICPELLVAMIERESDGKAQISNSDGDAGLLQVNFKWHYDRMERLGVTDLYDPYSNILVAADYLAELFRQNEDLYLVLMKYNMNHHTAEELYRQGVYSEYAMEVAERAWELERLHEQEGGSHEKTVSD